ncbi:MAG TPA: CDP-alcohol phosphatidyltransferase family protein [Candidatus Latescibacteria bacterium]|nr:CDP-alcohol phosphatidyltransferase family protein [Candidatus Latescibacterota bacterium]
MPFRKNDGPEFDFKRSLKSPTPGRLPEFTQLDRFVNRPIASLVVRAAMRTSLRPNHLTVAAFVLGLAGAFFFLGGDHRSFIIAGVLIYAGTILDGADGMLARSKDQCTRRGAYLDLYLDRITDFAVLGAMVTGYYYQSGRRGFYILSLLGLAAYMLQLLLYYLEREYWMRQSGSGASGGFRGLIYLGILAFSLLNRLDVLIPILLCIPALNIPYRFIRFWLINRPGEPPAQALENHKETTP